MLGDGKVLLKARQSGFDVESSTYQRYNDRTSGNRSDVSQHLERHLGSQTPTWSVPLAIANEHTTYAVPLVFNSPASVPIRT